MNVAGTMVGAGEPTTRACVCWLSSLGAGGLEADPTVRGGRQCADQQQRLRDGQAALVVYDAQRALEWADLIMPWTSMA